MKKKLVISIIALAAFLIIVFIAGSFIINSVSVEEAQDIALKYSGVSPDSAEFVKVEHYGTVYEVEFIAPDGKYEYEISSISGDILEFSKESLNPNNASSHSSETSTQPTIENESSSASSSSPQSHETLNAQNILPFACDYLGIKKEDVINYDTDFDDGLYEVEIKTSDFKYECKISANGEVVKSEKERR